MIGLHISKTHKYVEKKHNHIDITINNINVSLSYHYLDYRQVFYENEKVIVLLDGWIFNAPSYNTQCEFIADMFLKYNENFPVYLDGQFNCFIHFKRTNQSYYCNDIFSFRKHYIIKEKLSISSDIDFLYKHLDRLHLNEELIQKNLNQNKYIDIDETFIKEVNFAPRYAFIDFNEDAVKRYSFQKIKSYYKCKSRITPELFVSKVRKNIKRVHKDYNVLLQLSGGMDSRFLLENFIYKNIPVTTLVYGDLESDEVQIAIETAKANNAPVTTVSYNPEDFISQADKYMYQTCGLDIFVQSAYHINHSVLLDNAKSSKVMDTGIGLNTFIGGTQVVNPNKLISNNFSKNIFDPSSFDMFTSNHRIFSQLVLRQSGQREFMEDRYCMFSYSNYFLMTSISIVDLKNYQFYNSVANLVVTNSREVPIQKTMLPFYQEPTLEQVEVLKEKEKKSIDLYLEKKIIMPHKRYYSDFDMWLRSNKDWLQFVSKILIQRKPYVSKYISQFKLNNIIEKHKNGNSQMRLLIRILSTELFIIETAKKNNLNEMS